MRDHCLKQVRPGEKLKLYSEEKNLAQYGILNGIYDIFNIIVRDVRTCGQAHADLEDGLGDGRLDSGGARSGAEDGTEAARAQIGGAGGVDRLLMHGLPDGAGLDAGGIEPDTQRLDVVIGLAVGRSR